MIAERLGIMPIAGVFITFAFLAGASEPLIPFALNEVRLLAGPCLDAREENTVYLKSLDADRLLYTFRVNAGLDAPGEPLGGWEAPGCEVRGHFAGHYLSACAMTWAATGEQAFKDRAGYLVTELAKCQAALGGEYLSAFPDSFWDRLESGKNLPWAPYYTIHKIMVGLCDVYELCGNAQALDVLKGMASYFSKRTARFSAEDFGRILDGTEEGGMCDVLWRLYAITGDSGHMAFAQKFEKRSFLDPLAHGEDNLTGRHGNTHIPLVIGAMRRFQTTGEERYLGLAAHFWDRVVTARSFATGGTTNGEVWGEPFKLADSLSNSNHETCKTYNMLKLTRALFCSTRDMRYAEYYERAFFNGILGTQEPASGMLEYYVPQATGYRRVFGKPFDSFWCCYGTGIETFAKIGDSIYFHDSETLYVNLFIASQADWKEKGVAIAQHTRFPVEAGTMLEIRAEKPVKFRLNVRIPAWVAGSPGATLNGTPVPVSAEPGAYWSIEREWRSGDSIHLTLPMALHVQPMPDAPDLVAFLYGPIVLAGIMNDADINPILSSNPLETRPGAELAPKVYFVADSSDALAFLRPSPAGAMQFVTVDQPFPLEFRPFYQVVGEPYGLYWWVVQEGSVRHRQLMAENEALEFLRSVHDGQVRIEDIRADYARLANDPDLAPYKCRLAFAAAKALQAAGLSAEAAALIAPFIQPFIPRDRAASTFEILGPPPLNGVRPLLAVNEAWDGSHKHLEYEGRAAISTDLAAKKGHIYFTLPAGSPLRGTGQDARISIAYAVDGGANRRFCIEYDGVDGPYSTTAVIDAPAIEGWQETELTCPKALFTGRQNLASDFRVNCMGSGDIMIADVKVFIPQEYFDRVFSALDSTVAGEIDRVIPGEEASERAHGLAASQSATGVHLGRGWRHAEDSWRWRMAVAPDRLNHLICVYWGSDTGREFDILVDGSVIATQTLDQPSPGVFHRVSYSVPEASTRERTHVTVTFQKRHGYAGGVFLCATAAP